MLIQNGAMGAATASDGGRAPIASFWVRIMTSCISIKRGIWDIQVGTYMNSFTIHLKDLQHLFILGVLLKDTKVTPGTKKKTHTLRLIILISSFCTAHFTKTESQCALF